MCNCNFIPVTSTRQCESFRRQSKNKECPLEDYLQMKVKGSSNLDGPRTPHSFLNIIFLMDMFYSFSVPGNFLPQSVPLLKMLPHHSYLPFYCNSQEKQFLKGNSGQKKSLYQDQSHISDPIKHQSYSFCDKKSPAKRFFQKAPSSMLDWVLNVPQLITVARY